MEYFLLSSKIVVTVIYSLALTFLCVFGIHRYYLTNLYSKNKSKLPKPKGKFDKHPLVTVQLPVYNEMYVVERLISAVCDIDYPKELMEIQVLDDSTDHTTRIVRRCVNKYKELGFKISVVHRENREGFKAGALSAGLKHTSGEFVAIFDADFIPPKDFLKKTVDYFTDEQVGMVQVRWGHLNIDYSLLTKVQSILLDGHFMIEQTARYNAGLFFNFNGTAGVLRKKCIETSGGWQHDTLTEDLDLSYRAQLSGWKLVYLKDVIADAELPVDMNAFKSQQHRWAKGGVQTAIKLIPRIFSRKDLPLKVKAEAFFHLFGNISYLLLLMLLLLMFPMGYFWESVGWEKVVVLNLFAISAGTLSFFRFYVITVTEVHGKDWLKYIAYVPVAISVGVGMAINNSKAVMGALLGKHSEFVRTPKFAVTTKQDPWRMHHYASTKEITAIIELTLGVLFFLQTIYAIYVGYIGWIPFLILIQFGFMYTGFLSIFHSSGKKRSTEPVGPILAERAFQREKDY